MREEEIDGACAGIGLEFEVTWVLAEPLGDRALVLASRVNDIGSIVIPPRSRTDARVLVLTGRRADGQPHQMYVGVACRLAARHLRRAATRVVCVMTWSTRKAIAERRLSISWRKWSFRRERTHEAGRSADAAAPRFRHDYAADVPPLNPTLMVVLVAAVWVLVDVLLRGPWFVALLVAAAIVNAVLWVHRDWCRRRAGRAVDPTRPYARDDTP